MAVKGKSPALRSLLSVFKFLCTHIRALAHAQLRECTGVCAHKCTHSADKRQCNRSHLCSYDRHGVCWEKSKIEDWGRS